MTTAPTATASPSNLAVDAGPVLPPADLAALKDLVGKRRIPLSRQARLVLEFAIEHPYEASFLTCRALALATGSSPTSVARLSTLLGFESHKHFQGCFRRELCRRRTDS